jgi:Leucine rich repeat
MLANDRFAFETPNIIDPGDLPPSRPRNATHQSTTASTADSSDDDYQETRNQRLINDISDLELSPVKPQSKAKLPFRDFPQRWASSAASRPYNPYDDEGGDGANGHSLPSAEEARMHAKALLQQQQQSQERQVLSRTMKLRTPRLQLNGHGGPGSNSAMDGSSGHANKHSLRNRILHSCSRYALCLALVSLLLGVSLGVHRARHNNNGTPTAKERYRDILAYLIATGVSSEQDLKRNGSPQNIALNWVSTDPLQEAVPTAADGEVDPLNVMLVQRYVLAVLFYSTGGADHWQDQLGFVSNTLECSWNKVVPTPGYLTDRVVEGVSCDTDLRVTSIFIPQNGLTGSLPSELQYLPHLDVINFQDNRLKGTIPPQFGNLFSLLYLNLNNNTLTGPMPDMMGNWPALEVLGLALNDLEGTIPGAITLVPNLKTLALSNNTKLSGSLDAVSQLTQLQFFYAAGCSFSGRVQDDFFTSMPNLRQIDLSGNQLSGNVPIDSLLHEYDLEILDLAHNNFEGSFPAKIERNIFTTYISLRNNKITGTLPESISELAVLDHLDVQGNEMTGLLPNSLGRMVSLTYLFLGGNSFDDLVPPLSQLEELKMLSLGNMGLTGPIMKWLVYLSSLELLDLSHNKLTGTISQNIMNLPKLSYVMLNDNQLVGPMPISGKLLEVLSVQRNAIDDADFAKVCGVDRTVFADCSSSCTCCESTCCKEDDAECGKVVDDYFLNGLDYTMSFLAFDPDILDESGTGTFDVAVEDGLIGN